MEWVAKNTSPSHVRISRNPFSAWNTHNHAFTLFISCLFDITWRGPCDIAAAREADRSRASAFLAQTLWLGTQINMHYSSHLSLICGVSTFVQTPGCRPAHCTLGHTKPDFDWEDARVFVASLSNGARHRTSLPPIFSHRHRLFFYGVGETVVVKYCPTKIFVILWEKSCNEDYHTDFSILAF